MRTPLLESEALNERVGGRVLLKAECLQRTGSFKFRGAYNAISQIAADAVVAYSSGNHAQGVAAAARLLGKAATIVMPADAPAIKIENTRAYGAEVRLYDRRAEIARGDRRRDRRAHRRGADPALRRSAHHRRPGHRRSGDRRAGARARRRARCRAGRLAAAAG